MSSSKQELKVLANNMKRHQRMNASDPPDPPEAAYLSNQRMHQMLEILCHMSIL